METRPSAAGGAASRAIRFYSMLGLVEAGAALAAGQRGPSMASRPAKKLHEPDEGDRSLL